MKSDLYWSQILTFLPNFPIPKEIFFSPLIWLNTTSSNIWSPFFFFPPPISSLKHLLLYPNPLLHQNIRRLLTWHFRSIWHKLETNPKINTNAHRSHLTQDCHLYNTTITIFQLSTRAQTKCSARSKTLGLRKHTPKWNLFSKMRSFHFLF